MVISNKQTRRWTGWTNKKSTWANKQASKQTTQKSLKKIAISIFNGKCADKNKFFFIYSRASRELASLLGKMTAIRCKKAKKSTWQQDEETLEMRKSWTREKMSEHVWKKELNKRNVSCAAQQWAKDTVCSVCIVVSAIIISLWIKTFVKKKYNKREPHNSID